MPSEEYIRKEYIQEGGLRAVLRRIDAEYLIDLEDEVQTGQFTPGQFTPGQYTPGRFTPGQFNPGRFTPGQFTPRQFTPGLISLNEASSFGK